MSHRRTFSPAFKTQIVLALVSGTKLDFIPLREAARQAKLWS